jgi:hypothetical protein
MVDRQRYEENIRWVAYALFEPDEFMRRARTAASDLGPRSIETLARLFHSEHSPPAEIADQFPGLGDWISARQFAIFEMFYDELQQVPEFTEAIEDVRRSDGL